MEGQDTDNAKDPQPEYLHSRLRFFKSFEEMNEYDAKQMAALSPLECLIRLRHNINLAYGMHGYDPENTPAIRHIQMISYSA
ncbi:MAG: hypothetical protein K2Q22_16570 [Cytophagales bacterium]|nr:hypothetical protein [Cytophagales bacterium]